MGGGGLAPLPAPQALFSSHARVAPGHLVMAGDMEGPPRWHSHPLQQQMLLSPDPLCHFLQKDILMHRWRYPSLSLHGIEGAFSGVGAKTVIPRKVVGKFSIRLVPNMTPEAVNEQARGARGCGQGHGEPAEARGAEDFS